MSRQYRLYGKTELNTLKDALAAIINQWKAAWFVSNADSVTFNIESGYDIMSKPDLLNPEYYFCTMGEETVDIVLNNKSINELLAKIINTPSTLLSGKLSDITKSVVDKCLLSLIAGIGMDNALQSERLVLIESGSFPELEIHSGTVRLAIVIGASKLFLYIPCEIIRRYISKIAVSSATQASSLYKRSNCRIVENANLEILAGTTELDFGTVTNLCVGDVIRLDSRIDEPMVVTIENGTQVCSAFVGKKGNNKVAKIILGK